MKSSFLPHTGRRLMCLRGLFGCQRWKPILANSIEWKLLRAYVNSSRGKEKLNRLWEEQKLWKLLGSRKQEPADTQGCPGRCHHQMVFKWPEARDQGVLMDSDTRAFPHGESNTFSMENQSTITKSTDAQHTLPGQQPIQFPLRWSLLRLNKRDLA